MSTAQVTPIDPDAGRQPDLEARLDAMAVTWTFDPALPFERVDINKSLANQARVGDALDPEVVDQYTLAYQAGDTFPAVLARRTSARARLVLLGGNHRTAAAMKAGRTSHPAYVVECSDLAAVDAMYADNLRHGKASTRAERMLQAVHLVNLGRTHTDVARILGLHQADVSKAMATWNGSARARELNVPVYDTLPAGHRERLASIGSDVVFAQAVRVTAQTAMSTTDVNAMCKQIKTAGGDEKALTVIGGIEGERLQNSAGGRATRRARTPFEETTTHLTFLIGCTPARVNASAPGPDAKRHMRRDIKLAIEQLGAIDKALAR